MKLRISAKTNRPKGIELPFSPAAKALPEYWRTFSRFFEGKKFKPMGQGTSNQTVKACPPFLDSLMAGYVLTLEHDLYIDTTDVSDPKFHWENGGPEWIIGHDPKQLDPSILGSEFVKGAWKFGNDLLIETPNNYSLLFTHPLNRPELPFYTLSGIVDTDSYKMPVQFPFLVKKDFEGLVKAGTPIVQIIPIKREEWQHEVKNFDQNLHAVEQYKFASTIQNAYKNLWRRPKSYR